MKPTTISILPSHPFEGWTSMNRYWDAFSRCAEEYAGAEFAFHCPLKGQGICTRQAGKLRLGFEKQIVYPWCVRRSVRNGIAHILDHSYAFLLAAVPRGVRTIVTVHDLLPLREPDGLSAQSLARFRRRVEWVKNADLVIADSGSTRSDLIDLIGLDPVNIRVLPLGADTALTASPHGDLIPTVNGQFIFSIGSCSKRKNLEILPAILAEVRTRHPNVKLVRAGERLPESLVNEFHQRCGEDVLVELGRVPDELLSTLYQSAAVTIMPSRFEGFGLPLLEAMAKSCPVVSARTTSLPEVGGDAALYYEVDDAGGAAQQVMRILEADADWLNRLKERGSERARRFTWEIHFSKLLDIYREFSAAE
jgi:glycosyltransferase involved in cell wall biosynthesis